MNVIVICCDTVRPDFLSCYGNTRVRTPNLEHLAGESVLFENCICEGPPTFSTRLAWFSGKFTFPFFLVRRPTRQDLLLAEILWDKGYQSAMISDGWHLHEPTGLDVSRGFDFVQWIRGQEADPVDAGQKLALPVGEYFKPHPDNARVSAYWRARLEQYFRNTAHWKTEQDTFVARVMTAALKWLRRQPRRDNLFLWVDCFDPHEPWDPRFNCHEEYDPGYKGKLIIDPVPGYVAGYLTAAELRHIKALYAGEVTLVDRWIGHFLEELRGMGFYDNSLIVFTSDHGHPFGEHGVIKKARPYPYTELVHVPLVVRLPGGKGAGRRVGSLVETVDLMPTLLEFMAVPVPEGVQGVSLMPVLRGEVNGVRDYAYYGYHPWAWAIRDGEWSYILWFGDKGHYEDEIVDRPPELYHIATDPGEQQNVLQDNPEVARKLELELRTFVEKIRRQLPWP